MCNAEKLHVKVKNATTILTARQLKPKHGRLPADATKHNKKKLYTK